MQDKSWNQVEGYIWEWWEVLENSCGLVFDNIHGSIGTNITKNKEYVITNLI